MRASRLLLILLFLPVLASAQHLAVGIKVGDAMTTTFSSNSRDLTDESKRYTIGPSVELQLPKRFSIEVDALYRRVGYDATANVAGVVSSDRERDNTWEIPILVKYHLWDHSPARPFASAGYALRTTSGSRVDRQLSNSFTGSSSGLPSQTLSTDYGVTHGPVIGAGFELKAGPVRLTPEFRYTHWNSRFFEDFFASVGRFSAQNQAEFLLGISWR